MSKQITSADVSLFVAVTGDFNPAHCDPVYAALSLFKERIAHGMQLSGPDMIYLQQTLNFLAPVKIDDVVEVIVEVIELLERGRVRPKTKCVRQHGITVVDREALVMVPRKG